MTKLLIFKYLFENRRLATNQPPYVTEDLDREAVSYAKKTAN